MFILLFYFFVLLANKHLRKFTSVNMRTNENLQYKRGKLQQQQNNKIIKQK